MEKKMSICKRCIQFRDLLRGRFAEIFKEDAEYMLDAVVSICLGVLWGIIVSIAMILVS